MALGVTACLAGCGTRQVWEVTHYAHPNPLEGQTRFALAPVDWSQLKVGQQTEAEYVASKAGDFAREWAEDKAAMNALFAQKLAWRASYRGIHVDPLPSDAPFVIRTRLRFLQRGYFAGTFRQRARLVAVVDITRATGDLVDQLVVTEIVPNVESDQLNITAGARMRRLAEKLGEHTAQYVQARVAGG